MSEEMEVPAAEAVPEQDVTAAPVADEVAPEEHAAETAKTFTQEELDAIVAKRLAREQRKWERQQAQKPAAAPVEVPPADEFPSVEAYAEALAAKKAQELLQQQEAERQRLALLDAYHEREEKARERYDDFEQVVYNTRLPISNVMAETIQSSDIGPEIAYHLGSNPKETERISKLSPLLQAREIGKIEAKLADNPPVKKTTNAPPPIAPVSARANGAPAYDTTDPRSLKTLTTSQWIEQERLRQIKAWEAKQRAR